MEQLYLVLIKFIPVLLLILLGALIRKIGLFKRTTVQDLKTIIIKLSLPALLFLTFARTAFKPRYILIFVTVFLVCLLMLGLGSLFKKRLSPGNRYYPSLFTGFETGMLGYALFSAFFGAENTYKIAIFDIGQVSFVFFVLVNFLQKQNGETTNAKQLILSFIKSPVILAILLGVLFSTTGLAAYAQNFRLTAALVSVLNLLGNLTEPLICIIIGYELHISRKAILKPFLTVLLRMALMLGAAFLINEFLTVRFLGLDKSFEVALYTLFLLPPPFVIPIYIGPDSEEEKAEILNTISIHIVMTLVAFFVLVSLTA